VGRSGGAQRINTSNAWTGTGVNTTLLPGQIIIGNGYFGNLDPTNSPTAAMRGAKVGIWDSANFAEVSPGSATRLSGLTVQSTQMLSANITSGTTQIRGGVGALNLGGGANNYTYTSAGGIGPIVGWNQAAFIGQPNTTIALGNVNVNGGVTASFAQTIVYAGSNVGNAVAHTTQVNNSGNITNLFGTYAQFTGTGTTTPGNVFAYYMPSNSPNSFGLVNSNSSRAATNYYFLRNDDAVAQVQLGTLRSYNEYNYINATTSGALTIDKVNAQVQQVNLMFCP
jgi:hypothetical protein